MKSIISTGAIERRIYLIRGHRVMLDRDLAEIYGVTTKRLKEQVKRNPHRFPEDFMIHLSLPETSAVLCLRSQNATLKQGKHIKYASQAFTEHGAVMLASVLNSPAAVQASIEIVRAFVRLRAIAAAGNNMDGKIRRHEERLNIHDFHIIGIFKTLRRLKAGPKQPRRRIGFVP